MFAAGTQINGFFMLVTKEQAAEFLKLKTTEAAEKLLERLAVKKIDYSVVGGKGIRYRLSDIQEALDRITVEPKKPKATTDRKPRKKRLGDIGDIFDLPYNEQVAALMSNILKQ